MKNRILGNKTVEVFIQEICGIHAEIEGLVTKCRLPVAPADPATQKIQKIVLHLLTATDKIIEVGRDLNSITSCMVDVADNAQADDHASDHVAHILAWAGWTSDLTSNIVDTTNDLIRAGHDLLGLIRGKQKRGG